MTCESMSDLETLMRPMLRTVGMGHYWWLNLRLTDAEAESVVANDKQDERVQALRVQWERRALHRTHRRWIDQRGLLTVFPTHLDLATAAVCFALRVPSFGFCWFFGRLDQRMSDECASVGFVVGEGCAAVSCTVEECDSQIV